MPVSALTCTCVIPLRRYSTGSSTVTTFRVGEFSACIIEYSVVALLVHEALTERASQGRRVPVPALLAVLATTLVGGLDEGIQELLPSRVFDPLDMRDTGFHVPKESVERFSSNHGPGGNGGQRVTEKQRERVRNWPVGCRQEYNQSQQAGYQDCRQKLQWQ